MQTAIQLLLKTLYKVGFLLMLAPTFLCAQKFANTNHANWYKPEAPVHSSLLVWKKSPATLQVLASVRLLNEREISSYRLLLHLRSDLNQEDQEATPIPIEVFKKTGNQYVAGTDIPLPDSLGFLLLEVQDTLQAGTSFWSMATLSPDYTYEPPSFYLSQAADSIPLFRNYQKPGEPIIIQGDQPSYTLFYYQMPFDAAAPPLSASPASNSSLEVTETTVLDPDSLLQASAEGLYFLQYDTTSLSGQSFRVGSPYFPEIGTLEEFAGPIRYLSTQEEWNRMSNNEFSKKEIDRFWLKIALTEDRAKRIIKSYYDQVTLANHFFTSYKEGWKTDQGMVYILYGAPDIVTAEADREIWIYSKGVELPEIKFTFVRVKNPFTDRHLVLLRNKNYQRTHYQVVSQWRRGRKTL